MGYGLRLYTGFKDCTNAENEFDVEVWQKDYNGAAEHINDMGGTPLEFNMGDTSRWILDPATMQDSTFYLWATARFQYADLVSSDAFKNRVDVKYKNSTFWRGFIVTELYEEPLELEAEPVKFMAADLKLLENFSITLKGKNTPRSYLFHILNKLEFGFGFRISINIETELGLWHAFNNSLLDAVTFEGLNCLDALKELLKPYGANVRQTGGKWMVSQVQEKAVFYDYTDYDSNGAQTGTGVFSNVVATTRNETENFCDVMAGGYVQKLPPIKEFTIISKYRKIENFIKNGDFKDHTELSETEDRFDYWNATSPVEYREKEDYTFVNVKSQVNPSLHKNISQQIENNLGEFIPDATKKVKVSFKYALMGASGSASVFVQFRMGTKYLDSDYIWRDYEAYVLVAEDVNAKPYGEMSFSSFQFEAPVTNGQMAIYLACPQFVSGGAFISGVCYTDVKIELVSNDGEKLSDEKIAPHVINGANSFVPDDIELLFDNAESNSENIYEIYKNLLFPAGNFEYNGRSGILSVLLAHQITDLYGTEPLLLHMIIESDIFNMDSMLTDVSFPGRRFYPVYARYQPALALWEVDFMSTGDQVADYNSPDFDDTDFYAE